MLTEDYCSFEVAKLLKEKGFGGDCLSMYVTPKPHSGMGNPNKAILFPHGYYEGYIYQCEAPTQQMAMKWLRETYVIDIVIEISDPSVKDRKYYCIIWDSNNNSYILDLFNSYEEAVEAALKYALEDLI